MTLKIVKRALSHSVDVEIFEGSSFIAATFRAADLQAQNRDGKYSVLAVS